MTAAVTVIIAVTMIIAVATFVCVTFAVCVVGMVPINVPVSFMTVIILVAMIIVPMRFSFVLLRNRTARVEADVGDNRKRHRFHRLLRR